MKAVEYVEKYGDDLTCSDEEKRNAAMNNLLNDMMHELTEIMVIRNILTDKGAVSVIKELNQKWNAINRRLKIPVLSEDGYKKIWINQMPELADKL